MKHFARHVVPLFQGPRQVCAVVAAQKLRRGLLEGEGQHKAEHADDAEAHQV